MMNRTAKLRLLALIPLLLAALWYPAQKIRSYEFPAVPPQEFRGLPASIHMIRSADPTSRSTSKLRNWKRKISLSVLINMRFSDATRTISPL